jgi:CubicO group peptidase (beta-lactamase class C family)
MSNLRSDLGVCDKRLTRIQDWMKRYVDENKLTGAITCVTRRGETVFLGATGKADVNRDLDWSDTTIARFYSMTKSITSVALMMLYEKGLFHLDDPVDSFIPSFKDMRYLKTNAMGLDDTEPVTTRMTIHHLLTHCSVFTYDFNDSVLSEAYKIEKMDFGPTRGTLASQIEKLSKLPLQFNPGERWNYGVSTDVVGRLVEIISGKSLREFFQTEILDPLEMIDTAFSIPDDKISRFASSYQPAAGGGVAIVDDAEKSVYRDDKVICYSGGGGLLSTVKDYSNFVEMLRCRGAFKNQRLLGRKTAEFMTLSQLPGDLASMGQPVFSEVSFEGVGYGLGGYVTLEPAKSKMVGSVGDFGWGGMASTAYWVDPVEDLTVIFATQLIPSSYYPLRKELRALVYQSLID